MGYPNDNRQPQLAQVVVTSLAERLDQHERTIFAFVIVRYLPLFFFLNYKQWQVRRASARQKRYLESAL